MSSTACAWWAARRLMGSRAVSSDGQSHVAAKTSASTAVLSTRQDGNVSDYGKLTQLNSPQTRRNRPIWQRFAALGLPLLARESGSTRIGADSRPRENENGRQSYRNWPRHY